MERRFGLPFNSLPVIVVLIRDTNHQPRDGKEILLIYSCSSSLARRAKLLIASAWLLSGLFSIPAVFLNHEKIVKGEPQCWIELGRIEWRIYMSLVAISLFFIPAIIISACYFIIVHTIWRESRSMSGSRKRFKRESSEPWNDRTNPHLEKCTFPEFYGSHPHNDEGLTKFASASEHSSSDADFRRMSSRGVIPRAKIKTIKMTFVIVFGKSVLVCSPSVDVGLGNPAAIHHSG